MQRSIQKRAQFLKEVECKNELNRTLREKQHNNQREASVDKATEPRKPQHSNVLATKAPKNLTKSVAHVNRNIAPPKIATGFRIVSDPTQAIKPNSLVPLSQKKRDHRSVADIIEERETVDTLYLKKHNLKIGAQPSKRGNLESLKAIENGKGNSSPWAPRVSSFSSDNSKPISAKKTLIKKTNTFESPNRDNLLKGGKSLNTKVPERQGVDQMRKRKKLEQSGDNDLNISTVIGKLFGTRYRRTDVEDESDEDMEVSLSQLRQEERISEKIGKMEDELEAELERQEMQQRMKKQR